MTSQKPEPSAAGTRRSRGGRPTLEQATALDHAIREGALSMFLEHGYEGTSMNAIAAAAGTTKPTLYTRFPSKEAVFLSVLGWAVQRKDWPVPEPPMPDFDNLEEALTTIAQTALNRALNPSMIKLEQIAITCAERFPDLAHRTQGTGFWPRRKLVTELLTRHVEAGEIVAEDPETLAGLFLSMTSGGPARLASFGIVQDAADRERHVRSAVQMFLRSLRPD